MSRREWWGWALVISGLLNLMAFTASMLVMDWLG